MAVRCAKTLGDGDSELTLTVSSYEAQLSKAILYPERAFTNSGLHLTTNRDPGAAAAYHWQLKPLGQASSSLPSVT